jgi:hypothetical protein
LPVTNQLGSALMEPFDALSLCGEIAIAVTGFSGVVLAFGRRGGETYDSVDLIRLRMIFTGTLTPLGLIALASVLDSSMFDQAVIWQTCSAVHVLMASAIGFLNVRAGARADSGDPTLQVPRFASIWRGGAITLAIAVVVIFLQIANAASLHSFWPVLVAVWWGIALSLFAFVGLVFPGKSA